jgi:pyruvate/2-oxoglutarate/acetoin dehydrogenase E1 component
VNGENSYLRSLQRSLHAVFEDDPTVFILGEDIDDPYGGAFKVTKGLSSKFPARVISTPICEASIVGVATGLALRGMRAIAEIMFGDFIAIAADQIVNHAAKFATVFDGQVKIPLVIRTPMGGGRGYGAVHSQSLEKMFLGIPGLVVVAPSHFHSPGDLLVRAIHGDTPVLFVENKLLYPRHLVRSDSIGADQGYDIVTITNFQENRVEDVVILAYGGVSRIVDDLMDSLARDEIWVRAVFPSLISPVSDQATDTMAELVKRCGRVVIAEEGCEGFGWAAEMARRMYEACFNSLVAPIKCVGSSRCVIPACISLERHIIINKDRVEEAIVEVLSA